MHSKMVVRLKPQKSICVDRGQRLLASGHRPDLRQGRSVEDTTASHHEADVPRGADVPLKEVDARRVNDEVGKLARGQRSNRAVDAQRLSSIGCGSPEGLGGHNSS